GLSELVRARNGRISSRGGSAWEVLFRVSARGTVCGLRALLFFGLRGRSRITERHGTPSGRMCRWKREHHSPKARRSSELAVHTRRGHLDDRRGNRSVFAPPRGGDHTQRLTERQRY